MNVLRIGVAMLAMTMLVDTSGAFAAGAPDGATVDGTFALQTGHAKTKAYLRATPLGGNPLHEHLDFWMTPATSDGAIRHYTVDMTKLLHVIVVSDDFTQFLHIHPVLGTDGHFTLDQVFPKAAQYEVYADGEPQGIGQQVFRFALDLGGTAATPSLAPTGSHVTAGPYSVDLSTVTAKSGSDARVTVHVRRNGKPAADLHPYLGALAHCVFLNAHYLSYVHVHPAPLGSGSMGAMGGMSGMGEMSGMSGMSGMGDMGGMDMKPLPDSAKSSPDMELHLLLREPGTYKLWLQFRGGTALYIAPFVITAT